MNLRHVSAALLIVALLPSMAGAQSAAPAASPPVETVVKEAYVYGFPMVDIYRIMYNYSVDTKSPAYKGPFNKIVSDANVYTPADTTIQTPNSDTPYSFVNLDLRAEPVVLSVPVIPKTRYYSIQYVDQYTFNIAYSGSRSTGNGVGKILVAGPSWKGATPKGITQVIRFDTQLGMAIYRTQLFNAADVANVKKIQAGYTIEKLSAYTHTKAPPAAPPIAWVKPLTPVEERTSPEFFSMLAWLLQFCPVDVTEVALREKFSSIGIVAGKPFSVGTNGPALTASMDAGQAEIDAARKASTSSANLFGTRGQLKNDYVNRALGAQLGILGNTNLEAVYFPYNTDSLGKALTGTKKYTIHYAKGGLPPVRAFWSLTMYDLPQQLLVANPIDRYLINSAMLTSVKKDADGGLTLYIQHVSPGGAKASNWLPSPAAGFFIVNRLYWPGPAALDGSYQKPPIVADP